MKINYLISIFIILMLNKINAINCDSIDKHVQDLKDNQITILDNNSHLIIFFKANKDKKYYALIKEIPAYLSYVRCEDNIIYFSTIIKNNVTYISNLFQNSSIKQEIINVKNTNLTGYTDYLNNKYNLQLPIYDKNKLRKYLQQRSDINLLEKLNKDDYELMEGLLDDDSETRHIIPNSLWEDISPSTPDNTLWEDISPSTPDNTLLEGISPSTPDNTSTKDRVKEIQWSQTEDALIPDDSSKFIEDYADHKYTNTNDISTRFILIKNVSSNDGDLRFIKEKINELKHGVQIIIQILDQIDFNHDSILAFKIKLNTPHHNEHAPYYDIDLFKYSKIIYSVKHVKIDVNITHNSTNMLILDNDSADNIMFDAANIYIAKDTTIQQPLNEDLKLDSTAKPETNSRKRAANLISEQQPVKKIKIGSTTQSTHSLDETVDNHAQSYENISPSKISPNENEFSERQITNEDKPNYSELFNPYSEDDYFDVKGLSIKYIKETTVNMNVEEDIGKEVKKLKFKQEIRIKFLRLSLNSPESFFTVKIRFNSNYNQFRYYDVDFFKYKNLKENDNLQSSQIFIESFKRATVNFEFNNSSMIIRINKRKQSKGETRVKTLSLTFIKAKIYIYDPLTISINEKQKEPIEYSENIDLYNKKSEKQIHEILQLKGKIPIKFTSQDKGQNTQLKETLTKLDSSIEDTPKSHYSNSSDGINPTEKLLTEEIKKLPEHLISTKQMPDYSEFFNIYSDNYYFDVKGLPFKFIKEFKNNVDDQKELNELIKNLTPRQELRMKLFSKYKLKNYNLAIRIKFIKKFINRFYDIDVFKYDDLKNFYEWDKVKPSIVSFRDSKILVNYFKPNKAIEIIINKPGMLKKNSSNSLYFYFRNAKIYIYDSTFMSNEQIQPVIDHNAPINIDFLMLKFKQQTTEILSTITR